VAAPRLLGLRIHREYDKIDLRTVQNEVKIHKD
jgi:hypothetical protein